MIEYQKRILENGLTVLAHRDISTPMAAVNLLYGVGARNESPDRTGFAHLFEHLMFGGSRNVPSFDDPIQLAGGENNAFTNNDYTNYYVALPTANIETALWAESDRMGYLNFDERSLDVQRKVVIEEFNQRYLNQPYGDLWLLLRPLCYKVHPYRWATIGREVEHIRDATIDQVREFHERYYAPSNAILTVGADMEEAKIFDLAQKWFGDLRTVARPVDVLPEEPEQTQGRRLEVRRDVPVTLVYIAFPMAARNTREYAVCDVISDVLSNGTSSRLYQNLVKRSAIFSSVNAYVTAEVDAGLFVVTARLLPGVSSDEAEEALWSELEQLKKQPVTDYELLKNKNKFEATTQFSYINVLNKAINLSFFEMLGDADMINREVEEHNSVTAIEVQTVAARLFRPERANTLCYIAKKNDR